MFNESYFTVKSNYRGNISGCFRESGGFSETENPQTHVHALHIVVIAVISTGAECERSFVPASKHNSFAALT